MKMFWILSTTLISPKTTDINKWTICYYVYHYVQWAILPIICLCWCYWLSTKSVLAIHCIITKKYCHKIWMLWIWKLDIELNTNKLASYEILTFFQYEFTLVTKTKNTLYILRFRKTHAKDNGLGFPFNGITNTHKHSEENSLCADSLMGNVNLSVTYKGRMENTKRK